MRKLLKAFFLTAFLTVIGMISANAATITVNTAVWETGAGADCSLSEAITAANTNAAFGGCPAGQVSPTVDNIAFNIPGAGTVKTIAVSSAIPTITEAVKIDATTQAGASCTTPGGLTVELAASTGTASGFLVSGTADGTLIKGFVINRFPGYGIRFDTGAALNSVVCNYIGTSVDGMADLGNGGSAISISNAGTNTIGGTAAADRNLLSGNGEDGVRIEDLGTGAPGNRIYGNIIGLNIAGTAAMPNAYGISVSGADSTLIGDDIANGGNVISGNLQDGILIILFGSNIPQNSLIQNNRIGTNLAGTVARPNGARGIRLEQTVSTVVGGTTALSGNLISGNSNNGIEIASESTDTLIQANWIGTDATGNLAIPNNGAGVFSSHSEGTLVGGNSVAVRNVISGNISDGVVFTFCNTGTIQGNNIGTKANGSGVLGNGQSGIFADRTNNLLIGGTATDQGNRISGNHLRGVMITGGLATTNIRILSNSIFDNDGIGIDIDGNGVTPNDPTDNDSGANGLQNFPVITTALTANFITKISGTLNSRPNNSYRLEFFSSPLADPTGYGEGMVHMFSTDVNTDSSGNASFNLSVPYIAIVGHAITATATSVASNETSEFSLAKTLLSPTAASVSLSGRVLDPQGRGISGASVIATNGSGALVRSRTNPFGYYTLPEVTAGESVVITVADKRFAFAPRLITGSDDLAGVDFIGARLE